MEKKKNKIIEPILAFKYKEENPSIIDKLYTYLIQKWTGGKFYHVELIIDDVWISANPEENITMHKLRELNDNYEYVKLYGIELTELQYNRLWKFINSQKNKKYDWLGIFLSQIINIGIDNKEKWFCSELVVHILRQMYLPVLMDSIPSNISPNDLYKLLKVK